MTDAQKFQSTLSVRRATPRLHAGLHGRQISIHALREESDLNSIRAAYVVGISIHALREESDVYRLAVQNPEKISIHALREESDLRTAPTGMDQQISIHALREESDAAPKLIHSRSNYFNPRSP